MCLILFLVLLKILAEEEEKQEDESLLEATGEFSGGGESDEPLIKPGVLNVITNAPEDLIKIH